MRHSTVHAFKAVNRGLLDSLETESVSPAVTNSTLSETVAFLIDRWSRMAPRQKAWVSAGAPIDANEQHEFLEYINEWGF
jgi:hypothetical protein